MIHTLNISDDKVLIKQTTKSKTLYLDTWFWNMLAAEPHLKERFVDKAKSDCTVMYSITLFKELATITDQKQIGLISEVMDELDCAFISTDPYKVIKLEDEDKSKSDSEEFCSFHEFDHDLLNYFVECRGANISYSMSMFYEHFRILGKSTIQGMEDELAAYWNESLEKKRSNKLLKEAAKKRRKNKSISHSCRPYTRDILQGIEDYLTTSTKNMNRKEWMDFYHLIVPLSYLTIVVCDNFWAHIVESELHVKDEYIAKVFSRKSIKAFIDYL